MADQHNPNIPNAANVIAEDLVDIKENIEFHKDCFQALCDGWSDSSTAALAVKADTVATAMIQDDAVDNDKLADDAVDSDQIADGSVDAVHLASNAVETAKIKDANVTLAKLKTSTQTQSFDITTLSNTHKFSLTGGQYCFRPTVKGETVNVSLWEQYALTTAYDTVVVLKNNDVSFDRFGYVLHRYVTSSGEVHWIFILRDKVTKKIIGISSCDDHPCFGNSQDPDLQPHPFLHSYDSAKHEIIVINPSKKEVAEMHKRTSANKCIVEVIAEDYDIDETIEPDWPAEEVTVGIPKEWEETPIGGKIKPIKKVIPKPSYIKTASLKLKKKAKVI